MFIIISIIFTDSFKEKKSRGTWVAQSVECPASAQVVISLFMSSSPAGALCCQHRACFESSVPFFLCPSPTYALSFKNK